MLKKSLIISGVAVILIIFGIFIFLISINIKYKTRYDDEIVTFSNKYALESSLVYAVSYVESGFDRFAVSGAGAVGVMQLMPQTAKFMNDKYRIYNEEVLDLTNSRVNIELGCCYLSYLFDKFKDVQTVLFAYNAGEGNVRSWLNDAKFSDDGRVLKTCPYEESVEYVKKVMKMKKFYEKRA